MIAGVKKDLDERLVCSHSNHPDGSCHDEHASCPVRDMDPAWWYTVTRGSTILGSSVSDRIQILA